MTTPPDEQPSAGHVHPTLDDPGIARVSEVVGGPVGDHAGRHPWWTPARVVLVLAALCFSLGMVQKSSCYDANWTNGDSRYTHMCYSDLPYLYTGRGFAELNWPYTSDPQVRDRYPAMEYPVVISYWAYGTAWVTHWISGSPDLRERYLMQPDELFGDAQVSQEVRRYVVVNALGLAALALLSAWLLTRVNPRRPWDAVFFAASPMLALTALVNWDMLAVALTAGALVAWRRGSPVATGILIGLGTATKLYPLFLLGGILVIALHRRRLSDLALFGKAAAGAMSAWVFANMLAYFTDLQSWQVFWQFNKDRAADLGSVWLMVQQATGHQWTADTINNVSWLFMAVWCLGVLVIGLRAPETPRLAQLGFLIVTGFLLVNKVYSPQYVLWLLPLAVLARPRLRDQVIWQATELFYFASVWWYLGHELDPAGGGEPGFYWIAVTLRMLGELYLAGMIVRDILRPQHDLVDRTVDWPESDDDLDTEDEAPPADDERELAAAR